MKHIKIYENFNTYNIGDYIEFKIEFESFATQHIKGKIIGFTNNVSFPYKIIDVNDDIDTIMPNWITRKLTSEEIEDFNTKTDSKKYNL